MLDSKPTLKLTRTALALTLLYFLLWLVGPALLADAPLWFGLPLWFWLSCLLAPVILIVALLLCLGGQRG